MFLGDNKTGTIARSKVESKFEAFDSRIDLDMDATGLNSMLTDTDCIGSDISADYSLRYHSHELESSELDSDPQFWRLTALIRNRDARDADGVAGGADDEGDH